ncbi:Origin recognition complex subunit 6 [Zalerion maritima]|uniref:Origin recognition complex subunit 6 n=1 Tax=Zalerion maritima TaxID=339359 RepID=A0AAD5RKB9_9PEZI|nr:Origin recognition complex subunit 6 [Zalerion maritima]
MNRSVEPNLISLVPSLNAQLPLQLVELAGSLLAQSRHRASTLKGEEELARGYACAHIACERLKTSLDLPQITPRPPIPPRIYRRLYTHLDKILPTIIPGLKTPSKARGTPSRGGTTPGTGRSNRSGRATPSRRVIQNIGERTPSKSTGRAAQFIAIETKLPPWVHPTIRSLCANEWGNQKLVPTILAGIESIVVPGGKRSLDPWITDNFAPLLAAVALLVRTRQSVIAHGGELEEVEVNLAKKEIIKGMSRARTEVEMPRMDEEEAWEGYEPVTRELIETAVSRVLEHGWHEGDWYRALDSIYNEGRGDHDFEMQEGPARPRTPEGIKERKADSMFQDEWDFLTDVKREEFKVWKDKMLVRIEELEKNGAMDVDG